jgi:D-alanyl-D-alanine carboxypeptidase
MLEGGFAQNPLAWLTPALGSVNALAPIDAAPLNLKDEMCGRHRKRPAAEDDDEDADSAGIAPAAGDSSSQFSFLLSALRAPTPQNSNLLSDLGPVTPIVVYTGPTRAQPEFANAKPDHATARAKPNNAAAVAATGSAAWSPLSSAALAASPPRELGTASSDDDDVPLPRPRPRPQLRIKPTASR